MSATTTDHTRPRGHHGPGAFLCARERGLGAPAGRLWAVPCASERHAGQSASQGRTGGAVCAGASQWAETTRRHAGLQRLTHTPLQGAPGGPAGSSGAAAVSAVRGAGAVAAELAAVQQVLAWDAGMARAQRSTDATHQGAGERVARPVTGTLLFGDRGRRRSHHPSTVMTRIQQLQAYTIRELRIYGRKQGVMILQRWNKQELIAAIVKAGK